MPGFNLGLALILLQVKVVNMDKPVESKIPISLVMQNRVGKGAV